MSAFRVPDLKEMNFREDVVEEITMLDPVLMRGLSELGLLKTMRADNGVPLGIIGAMPRIPGVCEVFLLSTKDQTSAEYKTGFARQIKKEICSFKSKFRKIQSISLDTVLLRRWHRFLGFQEEGILKKYGMKGENMIIWGLS